jgi:hypothetical protein
MRPKLHSIELAVPKTSNMTLNDSVSNYKDEGQANNNMECDPNSTGTSSFNEPNLMTQGGHESYRLRFETVN